MSDEELEDSPSQHTRSQNYSRRAFTPISDRMPGPSMGKKSEVARSPKLNRVSKLPASPKNTGRSPKTGRRREKKKKLYPNLPKPEDDSDGMYTEDSGNDDTDDRSCTDEAEGIRDTTSARKRVKAANLRGRNIYPSLDTLRDPPTQQREGNDPAKDVSSNNMCSTLLYIVLLIAVFVVSVILFLPSKEQNVEVKNEIPPSVFELFKPQFKKIKSKYPSQTPRFWRIVSSQLKRLLTEEKATYPAVVLLGVSKKSSRIASCFSSDVISALNDVFNSTNSGYVDMKSLIHDSDDAAKIKRSLDDQLIQNLEKGRGVVLDHIEQLPAQAALLLHGYCDGDNAPYKQSVILLGLHTDNVQSDQRDVDNILSELWENDLGADEMPALSSRIGNNVVVLSHEPDFKC